MSMKGNYCPPGMKAKGSKPGKGGNGKVAGPNPATMKRFGDAVMHKEMVSQLTKSDSTKDKIKAVGRG